MSTEKIGPRDIDLEGVDTKRVQPVTPIEKTGEKLKKPKEEDAAVDVGEEVREFVAGYDAKGKAVIRVLNQEQAEQDGLKWENGKVRN